MESSFWKQVLFLFLLQTEATSHVGNRFHQLFSADLVEPTEEDLVIELSGHHHYRFNVQGTVENTVNFCLWMNDYPLLLSLCTQTHVSHKKPLRTQSKNKPISSRTGKRK